jgi:hypothetical protein
MPEIGSTTFSQVDASNTGPLPGLSGTDSANSIDNSVRALMGSIAREWNWRNFTLTAGGTADAKTLTYSVAPVAYYTGQVFSFIANTVNTGTATVNVNSLGAKTIKKDLLGVMTALSAGDMPAGTRVMLAYDGTDMIWVNWQGAATAVPTANSTTEVLTGTDTTKFMTADSNAALWEQGSDIASAGTISVGEGGYFNVTGTTTITDIDFATDKAGRKVWLKFAGALTLTHNATSLILPGGANITTAAGDAACFVSEGSDNVRCVSYNRASGVAVVAGTETVIRKGTTDARGTATLINDTDFTFSMAANTNYLIKVRYRVNLSTTSTGLKIGLSGPSSPTSVLGTQVKNLSSSIGLTSETLFVTTASGVFTFTQNAGSGDVVIDIQIVWRNVNSGTFVLQTASQSGVGDATFYNDSVLTYRTF